MSNITNGVFSAFLNIWIGEKAIHASEDNIISMNEILSTPTKDSSGSTVSFVLYDETALLVENELALTASMIKDFAKEPIIKYQYGYVGGDSTDIKSCMVSSYNIEFQNKGCQLTIECTIIPSVKDAKKLISPVKKSYKGIISDVVKQIAEENEWVVDVCVPTLPILDNDNTEVYVCTNMSPQDFITKELLKKARATEGDLDNNYFFSLIPSMDGKQHVVFAPEGYETKDPINISYTIGKVSDDVISFTPEFNNLMPYIMPSIKSDTNNKQSGEVLTYEAVTEGAKQGEAESATMLGDSYDKSTIESISKNLYSRLMHAVYMANIQLVGNIKIQPFMSLNIAVLTPVNTLHHSSGKYWIKEVENSISGGSFTTSCSMQRTSSNFKLTNTSNGGQLGKVSVNVPPSPYYQYEEGDLYYKGSLKASTQQLCSKLVNQGIPGNNGPDKMRNLKSVLPHYSFDGTNCMRSCGLSLAGSPYFGCIDTDVAQSIAKSKGEWFSPSDNVKLEDGDIVIVSGGHAVMVSNNGNSTIQNGTSTNGIYEKDIPATSSAWGWSVTCIIKSSRYC